MTGTPALGTGMVGAAVRSAYGRSDLATQVHVRARLLSCPMRRIDALVPPEGRVLDFGCGHGVISLWMAMTCSARQILAVDTDPGRVERAQQAAATAGLDGRLIVQRIDPDWRPPPRSFDAVVMVDVLYLLGSGAAMQLLVEAGAALAPGGVLVVKEMADRPRWKRALTVAQEWLAVRMLGITHGEHVDVLSESAVETSMHEQSLSVHRYPLDDWRVHPHLAWTGSRAVAPGSAHPGPVHSTPRSMDGQGDRMRRRDDG